MEVFNSLYCMIYYQNLMWQMMLSLVADKVYRVCCKYWCCSSKTETKSLTVSCAIGSLWFSIIKGHFFFYHRHAQFSNIWNYITVKKGLHTLHNGNFLLVLLSLCVSVLADNYLDPLRIKGGSQPLNVFFYFLEISEYPQNFSCSCLRLPLYF